MREGRSIEAPTESEAEVTHPEIAELEIPIQKLLEQLRPSIERGEYRLIIGDDASGRIPTFIFDKVLKALYREKGLNPPKTTFLAGLKSSGYELAGRTVRAAKHLRTHYKDELASDLKEKITHLLSKVTGKPLGARKVLLVTEAISSGMALECIVRALRDVGVEFDIATLGLLGDREALQKQLGGRLFTGGHTTPLSIFGRYDLAGTVKGRDIFSERVNKSNNPAIQGTINKAREDANKMAENLIKWYETSNDAV